MWENAPEENRKPVNKDGKSFNVFSVGKDEKYVFDYKQCVRDHGVMAVFGVHVFVEEAFVVRRGGRVEPPRRRPRWRPSVYFSVDFAVDVLPSLAPGEGFRIFFSSFFCICAQPSRLLVRRVVFKNCVTPGSRHSSDGERRRHPKRPAILAVPKKGRLNDKVTKILDGGPLTTRPERGRGRVHELAHRARVLAGLGIRLRQGGQRGPWHHGPGSHP